MKSIIFFLISFLLFYVSFAQSAYKEDFVLTVVKKESIRNVTTNTLLQFKPETMLKIKTATGKKLSSDDYILLQDAIVMTTYPDNVSVNTDTIALQEIVKIKGKVYGNTERKIGGAMLTLGGAPVLIMGYIIATIASSPLGAVFMMMPGAIISATGISLMGPRGFKTNKKWSLQTSSP